MSRHIGIFGGTFDPIHIGHLAAADDARADLALDQVLFVPNAQPPHKRGHAVGTIQDRVEMVTRAVRGHRQFEISLAEVERGGTSYTLDTLRELRASLSPDTRMTFLTGWDALSQLHTWHEPESILREFDVALIDRPLTSNIDWTEVERRFPGLSGHVRIVAVPRLEISSEEIRQRVGSGLPFRFYVPEAVYAYIEEHHLYRVTNLGAQG